MRATVPSNAITRPPRVQDWSENVLSSIWCQVKSEPLNDTSCDICARVPTNLGSLKLETLSVYKFTLSFEPCTATNLSQAHHAASCTPDGE